MVVSIPVKQRLREHLQDRRSNIPGEAHEAASKIIIDRLIQSTNWHGIRRVHCYVPISKRSEVDSWPLFRFIWQYYPHITTAVPGPIHVGQPVAYVASTKTTWHVASAVPLPREKIITASNFDLIVVPCLGFDEDRYRLGYGGGYYDRLLYTQTSATTIGLAFWAGYVTEGLPHEPHDIPLRRIITEETML